MRLPGTFSDAAGAICSISGLERPECAEFRTLPAARISARIYSPNAFA
jgi:hypothetical protein